MSIFGPSLVSSHFCDYIAYWNCLCNHEIFVPCHVYCYFRSTEYCFFISLTLTVVTESGISFERSKPALSGIQKSARKVIEKKPLGDWIGSCFQPHTVPPPHLYCIFQALPAQAPTHLFFQQKNAWHGGSYFYVSTLFGFHQLWTFFPPKKPVQPFLVMAISSCICFSVTVTAILACGKPCLIRTN